MDGRGWGLVSGMLREAIEHRGEAVLDEQVMRLSQVFNLKVGSQIMFNATPDSLIDLRCGEVSLYSGRMGRKGDKMAIRIEDRLIARPKD